MQLSINIFHWLIVLFLTARHTKSTQNDKVCNILESDILDYLDFRYVHRPPSHNQSIQMNKSAQFQKWDVRLL